MVIFKDCSLQYQCGKRVMFDWNARVQTKDSLSAFKKAVVLYNGSKCTSDYYSIEETGIERF